MTKVKYPEIKKVILEADAKHDRFTKDYTKEDAGRNYDEWIENQNPTHNSGVDITFDQVNDWLASIPKDETEKWIFNEELGIDRIPPFAIYVRDLIKMFQDGAGSLPFKG